MAIYSKCYLIKNQTVITSDSRLNIMTNVKSTEAHTTYHKTILSKTKNYTICTRTRKLFSKHFRPIHPKTPYKNNGEFFNLSWNYLRITGTIFNYYEQPHLSPQNQI